jgi:hypothetical protein
MTSRSFHRICFIRRLLPLSKVITRDIMASIGWLKDARTRSWGMVAASSAQWWDLSIRGQPVGIRRSLVIQRRRREGEIRLKKGIGKMR